MHGQLSIAVALLCLVACGDPAPDDTDPPRACNGDPSFCGLTVDRAAFAVSHNAFAAEADGYLGPNQTHGLRRQLDDGIRGLMLDLYDDDGVVSLCHATCAFGSRPLLEGLEEIAGFLDDDPGAVVLLVLERYTDPAATEAVFAEAGLLERAYVHEVGSPWPTLGELLDGGTPLLVFDQDPVEGHPWLMHLYTEGWDTDYAAETADDFSCDPLRGDPANDLFLLNHFLTAPIGSAELADQVNHEPVLGDRIARCEADTGDLVNLVAVDFYEIGDVLEVVRGLGAAHTSGEER